jgi:cysteinyl-tRNA synthetase
MSLKLFNTLTKQLEEFSVPAGHVKVNLYTCGPTVYNTAHIGNLRSYISADLLARALEWNGHDVDWVMNITDVDDKTIANTIREFGATAGVEQLEEYTDRYFQVFLKDLQKVNINPERISFVKVTEKIADIQLFILALIERGYAYRADDGSTYFSIEAYQRDYGDYGALVGEKFLEGKKVGARIKNDEYDKENMSDFALWKAHSPDDGQIFWDHPDLGKGRPGWHIECTVINYLKFPEGTDIHTGGIDLIFPHHTNEIAQAQAFYRPFVHHWMHPDFIVVDGKKMAKSAGNFYTLEDLAREHGMARGQFLRSLVVQSHYRTKINVTIEGLRGAKNGLSAFTDLLAVLQCKDNATPDASFISDATAHVNDDLNTAEVFSLLYKVYESDLADAEKLATIFKVDELLGLGLEETYRRKIDIPSSVLAAVNEREKFKGERNYTESDRLRVLIESQGFTLLDTKQGPKVIAKDE